VIDLHLGDLLREARINDLRVEMTLAYRGGDPSRARVAWELLRNEIKGRSPAVVERMEREKGLR
jgi:hypothetical protein